MQPRREPPIIVIDRNGQTTALHGWRRWVAMGTGYLVFALVVLVGVAALLGLAVTALMVLAVALPLALVLGLIAYATGRLKFDTRSDRFSDTE